jgi:hypothetical protein
LPSAYEETNTHTPTIIAGGAWSCPQLEGCEEKAGLSLISKPVVDSIG